MKTQEFKKWAASSIEPAFISMELSKKGSTLSKFSTCDNSQAPTIVCSNNIALVSDAEKNSSVDWASANSSGKPMPYGWDQNPANGLQVVSNIALTKSGWQPANPEQEGANDKFLNYIQLLVTCPYVVLVQSDYVDLGFKKSWPDFFDVMARQYTAMGINETEQMKQQLIILSESAASYEGHEWTWTGLSQGAVTTDDNKTGIFSLAFSNIGFKQETHGSGKSETTARTQTVKMTRVQVNMSKQDFSYYAQDLWNYKFKSWGQWTGDSQSPAKDGQPKKFCWN